ncbi:MAG: YgfZ/GcvT domain-containing protein [Woeseiaceae bacterium]
MPEEDSQLYKQITVRGSDAVEFLQGQLTQDIGLLANAGQLPAAWCNPKGRVIATLRLLELDSAIQLLIPANIEKIVLKRLMMYRMRSDVEFVTNGVNWTKHVSAEDADPEKLIAAGVPTIDASNTEKYTPHMLNLDKLGAISFSKGCYAGQEVVARTENLGKSKRRLMRYLADKDGLSIGAKLSLDDRNVGEIVNISGHELLAVTPIELHDQNLVSNGTRVVPMGLPYLI